MHVKCLSVETNYAYTICLGFKPVENRFWTTTYRGELYIHSCGDYSYKELDITIFPQIEEIKKAIKTKNFDLPIIKKLNRYYDRLEKFYGTPDIEKIKDKVFCVNRAIIGKVILSDIIRNSVSLWAEKNCYHWILTNPVLFDKPITNIIGKQRIFNYNLEA